MKRTSELAVAGSAGEQSLIVGGSRGDLLRDRLVLSPTYPRYSVWGDHAAIFATHVVAYNH